LAPYSLHDDRTVEYGFVYKHLDRGSGPLLDLGSSPGFPSVLFAQQMGWKVTAIDLNGPESFVGPGFAFVKGNFLQWDPPLWYDRILSISTIEHFGLGGRYGVEADDPTADLVGMKKLWACLNPWIGWMLITLPVGNDDYAFKPWHRIYGPRRLHELFTGFHILNQEFYAKVNNVDTYRPVLPQVAFNTAPQPPPEHYYAIGCFKLARLG